MDIKRLIFFSVLIPDGFVQRAVNDTNFELKQRGFWLFPQLDLNLEPFDLDTSLLFTVAMFFTTMIETTIVKVSSEVKLANRDQPFPYSELDLHKLKWLWRLLVLNGKLIIENSFPPSPSCMDLVAELSTNPKAHKEVITLMPLIAEAAHYKHYTQHLHLLETVCTQVNQLGNIIM